MVRSSAIKREGTKDARPQERGDTPERDCIRNKEGDSTRRGSAGGGDGQRDEVRKQAWECEKNQENDCENGCERTRK